MEDGENIEIIKATLLNGTIRLWCGSQLTDEVARVDCDVLRQAVPIFQGKADEECRKLVVDNLRLFSELMNERLRQDPQAARPIVFTAKDIQSRASDFVDKTKWRGGRVNPDTGKWS